MTARRQDGIMGVLLKTRKNEDGNNTTVMFMDLDLFFKKLILNGSSNYTLYP